MPEYSREERVLDAFVALVDSLLDDFDVVDLLTDLTERCAQLLDIASAGLLLAGPGGQLHLMAATSRRTEQIELFQLQANEGPCLDCYLDDRPVSVADLTTTGQRWPRFVSAALAAGFASVHAVPMRAAGTSMGALGLFGTTVGPLNDADLLVARTLAHVASVAIVQEHPPTPAVVLPNLHNVLARQVVVEQANGFVQHRLDVSAADAFDLLRRQSHRSGVHLSDLARRLMSEPASREGIVTALAELPVRRDQRTDG